MVTCSKRWPAAGGASEDIAIGWCELSGKCRFGNLQVRRVGYSPSEETDGLTFCTHTVAMGPAALAGDGNPGPDVILGEQ